MYLFQATAILAMTLGFGVWILGMRAGVLDRRPSPQTGVGGVCALAGPAASNRLGAADRPAYERLSALMDEGIWREEGLTVAALAQKVGVREHQLWRLINGQLGFRNFSAFLNSYRIEDAKRLLADPMAARKQILQIALELGYGSIAPFNRAFKEATAKTPTEFRRKALGET